MRDVTRRVISMGGDKDDIKRISGDGLFVKLDSNDRVLEITGDGCKITMMKNCGSVRVVGDGCRLNITENEGDVEYTGDGGRVCLGPKSSKDNVRYIGTGGKVTVNSNPKETSLKNQKNTMQRLDVDIHNSNKKIDDRYMYVSRKRDKGSPTAEMENLLNERKEAENQGNKKCRENERKSENGTIVTSKSISTVKCDGHLIVKKWFISPATTIESFDGNSCTKTLLRYSKTNASAK